MWKREFGYRKCLVLEKLDLRVVDKPEVERQTEIGAEDPETARGPLRDDENLIPFFLGDDDDVDDDSEDKIDGDVSPAAEYIRSFCPKVTRQSLNDTQGQVALLDEFTLNGNIFKTSYNQQPLTAHSLHQALRLPRFPLCKKQGCAPGNTSPASAQDFSHGLTGQQSRRDKESTDPKLTDQEFNDGQYFERISSIQRIYISDLDPLSIGALIGTVSQHQAPAFRSFIYKHLVRRPSFDVSVPTEGLRRFELAFHIPYREWRDTKTLKKDARFLNGNTLRSDQDVSYLNFGSNKASSYVYNAQVSLVLVGLDDYTWKSCCCDDAYFQRCPKGSQPVVSYNAERRASQGMHVDPTLRGKNGVEDVTLDPREYFLTALAYNLIHVKEAYERIGNKLSDSIERYDRSRQASECLCASTPALPTQKDIDFVKNVAPLSEALLTELSSTIETLKAFCDTHQGTFDTELCQSKLNQIKSLLLGFEEVKKTFHDNVQGCQNLIRRLKLSLSFEFAEAGRDNKSFSKMMIEYVSPFAIAPALFSMNGRIIPPRAQNIGTFIAALVLLSICGRLGYNQSWYRRWVRPAISRASTSLESILAWCLALWRHLAMFMGSLLLARPSDPDTGSQDTPTQTIPRWSRRWRTRRKNRREADDNESV